MENTKAALPIVASFALGLAASAAHAASVPPPAGSTTLIDQSGQVVTGNLAGGLADPVPLFSNASGPVLFVIAPPGETEAAPNKPHAVPKAMTLTTSHIGQR